MTTDRDLHDHLIGQQGSRADLNTPVLVLDVEALDRNIHRMAALAAGAATGEVIRIPVTPPSASTSASPILAQQTPTAPAAS